MPIAPITQLSYPQKPGPLEQLGTGILDPLNQYTSTKLNQLLERQNASEIGKLLGPGLQNLLKLESPEIANKYGTLAAYSPQLLSPLISGMSKLNPQKLQDTGRGIQLTMPDAQISDQNAQILANLNPAYLTDLYRNYNATPRELRPQLVGNALKNISTAAEQSNLQNILAGSGLQQPKAAGELPSPIAQQAPEELPATKAAASQKIAQEKASPKPLEVSKPKEGEITEPESVVDKVKRGMPLKQAQIEHDQEKKDIRERKQAEEKQIKEIELPFYKDIINQEKTFDEQLKLIKELRTLIPQTKERDLLSQIAEGTLQKYAGVNTQAFKTKVQRKINAIAKRLQALDAALLKGPVGKYRLQFIEEQKPSIEYDQETNNVIMDIMEEKAKLGKYTAESARSLVKGGTIPKGLSSNSIQQAEDRLAKGKNVQAGKIGRRNGKYVQVQPDGSIKEISEQEAKAQGAL